MQYAAQIASRDTASGWKALGMHYRDIRQATYVAETWASVTARSRWLSEGVEAEVRYWIRERDYGGRVVAWGRVAPTWRAWYCMGSDGVLTPPAPPAYSDGRQGAAASAAQPASEEHRQ